MLITFIYRTCTYIICRKGTLKKTTREYFLRLTGPSVSAFLRYSVCVTCVIYIAKEVGLSQSPQSMNGCGTCTQPAVRKLFVAYIETADLAGNIALKVLQGVDNQSLGHDY